jgi:hypothetical protein
VKPYQWADAETDLADAMASGDLDEARRAAAWLDQMGPPPRATVLGAALWYAERGLPVFPLQPGLKVPMPGSRGVSDASTDPDLIRSWFQLPANLGLATGHRVDVIDFDGFNAHASWETKMRELRQMPQLEPSREPGELDRQPELTWELCGVQVLGTVSTPRPGGLHVYVAATGAGNSAGLVPGVDYRGLGGYVVVPPSSTPVGHYRWLRRLDFTGLS